MNADTEGLPLPQVEKLGQAEPVVGIQGFSDGNYQKSLDQNATPEKPPEIVAGQHLADESQKIAEVRQEISKLVQPETKRAEDVVEQAGATEVTSNKQAIKPRRKSSIVGTDPYPGIPSVRAEEIDNTPIVAGQDFQPEDFDWRSYFHGLGLGSNYGKIPGGKGYRAYDNDRFWNPVIKAIKKYLPPNATRLLEVGCAEGYLVKRLQQTGLKEAIGIDISPTVLEEAKRNVPAARFEEINLNRDNFNPALNGTFDVITATDVLEHIAHRITPDGTDINGVAYVVPKLVELLKKDGVFMMSAPVVDKNIVSRIFNLFDSDKSHVSKLSSEEYLKILEQNGLEVMEKRYTFLVPWFRIPYLHTALEVVAKKK